MKNLMIMMLLVCSCIKGFAQNNPIFKGGNADGWNNAAYQQASNNIFNGGNNGGWGRTIYLQAANNIFNGGDGDGWNRTAFSQAVNNIFNGGTGDGWDSTFFSQAANNIFNGGTGDGWDSTAFSQAMNNIFNGGTGDGWDSTAFSQAGNNIFFGGAGDGWSSTYRPMGPLPVTLLYFTAKKNTAVSSLLEWKTSQEINSAYFDIERSNDAVVFSKIGTAQASGNSSTAVAYSFIDNNPVPGNNYYRLKQFDLDGRFVYTPARLVRFDENNGSTVQYYPNPTRGKLYIETAGINNNEQKVINISTAAGVVVDQVRIPANANRIIEIDMSRFAKGTYFVQFRSATLNSTQRIILQ